MSVIARAGAVLAALILGYFAIGFIAEHWAWFVAGTILLCGTAVATWVLLRSRGRSRDATERALHAEREALMKSVDDMQVPMFDAMIGRLLVGLDAKRVKKFGHRSNTLGCNFVVTLHGGRRIVVRAKKDDRTVKREGARHIQLLGGEIQPRWSCDAGVLITNANLHGIRHAARNQATAAQLGVFVIDRRRLAEWLDTGEPPAALLPATKELSPARS
ncbi:restriction endonuclease [Glycomyces xiaoerkulensis]|uniref:restriction endonuclease n=1 Tax=Glycomyces xiaoerkulensis TaxID=2038139 RepID=UPI0013000D15|nr:restriction endonuclease [Glycomyces xiaoerkulensis]